MTKQKQWIAVGLVVAGVAVGATALAELGEGIGRVEVGAEAPDFRVVDLATGDSVSLREQYRGKVTLVNIWATWCIPCRTEMPSMEALYRDFAARGFEIAAVSIDQGNAQDVRNFVDALGLTFDVLQDRSGGIQQRYQTTGVPESFLLDRNGIIVRRLIGAHDWNSETNRTLVDRLLEGT
jgi:cytochrome c biogenesis protein CcmG, thiol:disulfide interchange protein DsbE